MVISFTGRRPKDLFNESNKKKRYDINEYKNFVNQLTNKLKTICDKHPNEQIEFISGGAQGFDQLAFWAVDKLKKENKNLNIINTVFVPHKKQPNAWAVDGLFGQKQFQQMLNMADRVQYLKGELTTSKEIRDALFERNHEMVNVSDLVIALHDRDDWETIPGGTAECMRYAKKCQKDIIQLKFNQSSGNLNITDETILKFSPDDKSSTHKKIQELEQLGQ